MRKLIILSALILTFCTTKAQVKFNNGYTEPVWVAIGWYMDIKDYKGWMTKGWFKVEPGETVELLGYLPPNPLYYYAQTKGGVKQFEGGSSLLVDPNATFTIKNADKEYVKNNNAKYAWRKFREHEVKASTLKLWTTIDFKY